MSRTPTTVYLLHGMKRSGNHALMNWLLPQLRCAVVNNAIPLGPILRGGPWPPRQLFDEWWRAKGVPAADAGDAAMVSLEDHDLTMLPFEESGVELRRLLIVRRPEQLFSSRLRKASKVDMPAYPCRYDAVMRRATDIWKQHARCFLGEGKTGAYPGRIAISFDAWFGDSGYRAAISEALGVGFDDRGFGRVGGEGGGSSFNGVDFDGRAHEMSVMDRVSQLEPHERAVLDEILADPEMHRLGEAMRSTEPRALLRIK